MGQFIRVEAGLGKAAHGISGCELTEDIPSVANPTGMAIFDESGHIGVDLDLTLASGLLDGILCA